jgi:hypothetical protein
MKAINTKTSFVLLLLLGMSFGYSQNSKNPFKPRFQKQLQGDVIILANNVTNRADYSNSSNIPYYNHTSSAMLNDDFFMEYIDIDEDESTFSSSSAELFLDTNSPKKIVYAGLYWTGTYKYNSGEQVKEDKFSAVDPARENINTVKLKLPNQTEYTSVSGTVIFDGLTSIDVKDAAPYVVYADITDQVLGLTNPSGVYTLANIRATQGSLKGGVASGWQIFMVYEDHAKPKKNIITYDGFSEITSSTVHLNFTGFETVAQGQVKAQLAVSALDGDYKVAGDEVSIKTSLTKDFVPLANKIRKPDNFFNSSITVDNKHAINRYPDSKNTLGFDSCLITIPNENNTIIANNTADISVKIQSDSDKCFVFFTSFIVDESIAEPAIKKQMSLTNAQMLELYDVRKVQQNKEMYADLFQTTSSKNYTSKTQTFSSKKSEVNKEVIEVQTLNISNQEKGFYIVAKAFTVAQNAKNFVKLQNLKDIPMKSFVNKINSYTYAYLERFDKLEDAISYYVSKGNGSYEEKLYIVSINNDITGLTDTD